MRVVSGRRGQAYLLCRNEQLPEKYPRQPVMSCTGYTPGAATQPDRSNPN